MRIGTESYDRFLQGDKTGMQELVELYRDGLILYINSFVGSIDEAEDVAEDVFVELVVKRPHFNHKCSFKTWLYGIARHKALNFIKKMSRVDFLSDEELSAIPSDQESLEKQRIIDERKITVHRALGKIKYEYRQVLYLSFFEEFSNDDIAIIMKKNKRQIENLLYRSKLSLKAELGKENFKYEEL